MTHFPSTNALLRLSCAGGAVLTTALVGLFVHSLAHTNDVADRAQATALHAVVAQTQPR